MSDAWKQWAGQVVNGQFPLLQYLGGSDDSAVFLTERKTDGSNRKAALKLVPSYSTERDEVQLSQWRLATELSEAHLIRLYESGRCDLGNVKMLYVVMEYAPESLADALAHQALTADEVRATLEPVVDVLTYLHGKGLVHGHIKPANILADGDQVKVSSDGLARRGDSAEFRTKPDAYCAPENRRSVIPMAEPMSPAADVWSLGMTVVECLTQKLPDAKAPLEDHLVQLEALPQPFLDIARHCLVAHPEGRWSAADITARLEGRVPMPVPVPQARRATPPPQPPKPIERSRSQGQQEPIRPRTQHRRYVLPIMAGVLVVAVLTGLRLLHRGSESSQTTTATLQEPSAESAPPASQPVIQVPALQSIPEQPAQASRQAREQAATTKAPTTPNAVAIQPASESAGQAPAATQSAELREEPNREGSGQPIGNAVPGEVAQQVLPNVTDSARNTIQGTIHVIVRVDVDRSGSVVNAELQAAGPSKYFANAALRAAQGWKFKAPTVAGRGVPSSWTLQFNFTSAEITVTPSQDLL